MWGMSDSVIHDGYWYCPSLMVYPRTDGVPAPEEGCTETEPVFVADDGQTATGTHTGVYRPVPAPTELPATGLESGVLVAAVACVAAGAMLRRVVARH